MEHEEIVLDHKVNTRNKGTRYGMRTRNTVKYNRVADLTYQKFKGEITDATNDSIAVSLSKRKNWELVTALEDSDANVRVVEMPHTDRVAYGQKGRNKALALANPPQEPEPEEPTIVNGSNRKGFFVREKRAPGKRGVMSRKQRGAASDGEDHSDSSSAEEQGDDKAEDAEKRVICVWKRDNRQHERDWRKQYGGCNCEYCTGIEKNQTTKNRTAVRKELVDVL